MDKSQIIAKILTGNIMRVPMFHVTCHPRNSTNQSIPKKYKNGTYFRDVDAIMRTISESFLLIYEQDYESTCYDNDIYLRIYGYYRLVSIIDHSLYVFMPILLEEIIIKIRFYSSTKRFYTRSIAISKRYDTYYTEGHGLLLHVDSKTNLGKLCRQTLLQNRYVNLSMDQDESYSAVIEINKEEEQFLMLARDRGAKKYGLWQKMIKMNQKELLNEVSINRISGALTK